MLISKILDYACLCRAVISKKKNDYIFLYQGSVRIYYLLKTWLILALSMISDVRPLGGEKTYVTCPNLSYPDFKQRFSSSDLKTSSGRNSETCTWLMACMPMEGLISYPGTESSYERWKRSYRRLTVVSRCRTLILPQMWGILRKPLSGSLTTLVVTVLVLATVCRIIVSEPLAAGSPVS